MTVLLFADENDEPAPTCCVYHSSGGYQWIACGVDPYDQTWEEDAPAGDMWGSFRDGMRRYINRKE